MNSPETQAERPGVGDEQFRVPKVQIEVDLTLEDGLRVGGAVHLLPLAGVHVGRERVIDLLAAPDPQFLPVAISDRVQLVHKTRVILVGLESPEDAGLLAAGEEEETAETVMVEVELAGLPEEMRRVTGLIYLKMPPGQRRVIDYLNQPEPFFPLQTSGGLILVNKAYVLDVFQP